MPDEVEVLAPETVSPAPATEVTDLGKIAADAAVIDGNAAPVEKDVPPDWPDDWRTKASRGDEKKLKGLERYKSIPDIADALIEAKAKLSERALPAKIAADATPEQVTAWRKDNGIPDKADGYLENLPKGLVIGEADKPLVDSFLAKVHGKNAAPEVVAEALDWYYGAQEEMIVAQAKADAALERSATDELRAEWGAEFRANETSIYNFLDGGPPADDGTPFRDLLLQGRLSDGTKIKDNPVVLRWLAGLASDANPAGFIAPNSSGAQIEGVRDEIAKIEKVMRDDITGYRRDKPMQARLLKLYEAEEKLGSR